MSAPAGAALVVFLLAAVAGAWLSFTPPSLPSFQVVALVLPDSSPASSQAAGSLLPATDTGTAPVAESASQPAGEEGSVAEASIGVSAAPPAETIPEPVFAEAPEPEVEPEPVFAEAPEPEAEPVAAATPEPEVEPETDLSEVPLLEVEPEPDIAAAPEPAVEPEPDIAEAPEPGVEPELDIAEASEPEVEPEPVAADAPAPVVAKPTPAVSDGIDAAAEDAEPFDVAALSPDEAAAVAPAAPASAAPVVEPQLGVDAVPEAEPEISTVPEAPAEPAVDMAPALPGETWLAYARPFDDSEVRPRIAIVVAGLGLGPAATRAAIQLPGEITLAFSSHARDLQQWIDLARAAGHEVLLDLPMEPIGYPAVDPGPQSLLTTLPSVENVARLKWHLDRATGYVGVTHNMGSRFTASPDDLRPVLSALKVRGLLFLDARTASNSVAARLATAIGLPRAINDRFLDAQASRPAIDQRLREIEAIALANGFSVAVSHPFPVTLERIGHWAANLDAARFALAPISALVNKQAVR